MQVTVRLPQLSAWIPQPGVRARGPRQGGALRLQGGIPQPGQQVHCDHDDQNQDDTIPGDTGTGAGRTERGGAQRRVRATASGQRTGTAGQTGQGCLRHIGTPSVSASIPKRVSSFKMLSNNYGNAEKKGRMMILWSVQEWGKLAGGALKDKRQ